MSGSLYNRMTDDGKAMELRRRVQTYREAARIQVEREFPELAASLLQAKRARRIYLPREDQFDAPDLPVPEEKPKPSAKPGAKPDAKPDANARPTFHVGGGLLPR